MDIRIKRAYVAATADDGVRVLVDRLWPRGVSKEKAQLDLWLKEIAPSTELRKWFHHDAALWDAFRQRYVHELESNSEAVKRLVALTSAGRVTLIYGARDEEHNEAVVLKEYLEGMSGKAAPL